MRKVISYTDKNYFKYGKLFLETRHLVDAHFIVYGASLTEKQKTILENKNIEFRDIDPELFQKRMQCLKFDLILENIDEDGDGGAFLDFDTFFLKDWSEVYEYDFDAGITFREPYIKKKILRAYANGGVIMFKNTQKSKDFWQWGLNVIENFGSDELPAYDAIFKTFEKGSDRPDNKIWDRKNLRWWVDQVFLSCFPYMKFHGKKSKEIGGVRELTHMDWKVLLLPCGKYNFVDPTIRDLDRKSVRIFHLKNQGRAIVDKLMKKIK